MYAFVEGKPISTSAGSTKTLQMTFSTPLVKGDTVIVGSAYETDTNTAQVVDGAGNIYTPDTPYIDAVLHWRCQWFRFTYTADAGTSVVNFNLVNGVASKGAWAVRDSGLDPAASIITVPWNKQVAPGIVANTLVTNSAAIASNTPYMALALSMSKTGSSGALPGVGTPGYNNRAGSWTFAGGTGNCARLEDKRITNATSFNAVFTPTVGTDTYISGLLMLAEAPVINTEVVNPMGLAYTSVTGVQQYAKKSGMLITGQTNRYDPAFATARAAGAEVLAYIDAMEGYQTGHSIGGLSDDFYQIVGGIATAPSWGNCNGNAGTTLGAPRQNFVNTYMLDIRAGSTWSNHVVAYVENLMRENKVDGVFLDVVGGRLFSTLAAWGLPTASTPGDWTQQEMQDWTAGCIDLVRRLDASRRAINPAFIIVNNNTWDTGDALNNGFLGEQYVDGVDLEHHPSTSSYQQAYAGKYTFSNLGHRRFLVIAQSTADAIAWAKIQGVTDVSDEAHYNSVSVPPIPFSPRTDRVAPTSSSGSLSLIKAGSGLVLPFAPANITVATATVPNVVNSAKATAEAAIVAANLTVGSETTQSSGTVTSGNVINQSPAASTSVNVGSAVNLTLSSGAAPTFPDPSSFFHDDFESGGLTTTNSEGFSWGGYDLTSIVQQKTVSVGPPLITENVLVNDGTNVNDVINDGRDWTAYEGLDKNCLRFRYPANGGTGGQFPQQNFDMGTAHVEVYMRYQLRVPTSFIVDSANDKFVAFWQDAYETGDGSTAYLSHWPNGSDPTGTRDVAYTYSPGGGQPSIGYAGYAPFFTTADHGRWMQVCLRLKCETSPGAADGVIQFWRRWQGESSWTQLINATGLPIKVGTVGTAGFRRAYLMGSNENGFYTVQQEFMLDQFELSLSSLAV